MTGLSNEVGRASLAERCRPKTFEAILGQDGAVDYVKEQVRRARDDRARGGGRVLLFGPPGTGKTSLAEIYAQALHCQNGGINPCLRPDCPDCESYLRTGEHPNLRRVAQGELPPGELRDALTREVDSLWSGGGCLVVIVDQAHRLSADELDIVHDRIERAPPKVTFVFCTTEIDRLPQRTRDLFPKLHLGPLSIADRLRLLERASHAEGIEVEESAFFALARHGGGRARALLTDLEVLATKGVVSVASVEAHFADPKAAVGIGYLKSIVARESLSEQFLSIDGSALEVGDVPAVLRGILVQLFGPTVLGLAHEQLPASSGDARVRQDLTDALLGRGKSLGLEGRAFFTRLMGWWSAPLTDRASLVGRLNAFDEWLNGPGGAIEDGAGIGGLRQRRQLSELPRAGASHRRRRASGRNVPPNHLSDREVQAVWDAASFLIQKFGLFFRARLSLRWELPPGKRGYDEQAVGKALTALLHEMRLWMNRRRARKKDVEEPFHWVRVHGRDGEGRRWIDVVMTLPPDLDVKLWVGEYMKRVGEESSLSHAKIDFDLPDLRSEEPWTRHFSLLSVVLAGIDPAWRLDMRDEAGQVSDVAMSELLGVSTPQSVGLGKRRVFASRYIDGHYREEARRILPFLSAFDEHAWHALRSRWELEEFAYRRGLEAEYAARVTAFEVEWPDHDEQMEERRKVEKQRLEEDWTDSEKLRVAARPGWEKV